MVTLFGEDIAKILMAIVVGISFLAVGVTSLIWPRRIQKKILARGRYKIDPFYNWMKTESYIVMLRVGGVISLAVFILLMVALWRQYA
jgi:hypothetical protein